MNTCFESNGEVFYLEDQVELQHCVGLFIQNGQLGVREERLTGTIQYIGKYGFTLELEGGTLYGYRLSQRLRLLKGGKYRG